jgi:8-oxo-dGTP diphosphatase
VYRDPSGKTLADYPRPSVAVDTAVLTVGADGALTVLLIRRAGGHRRAEWALPGTFLHPGETLADAVRRSLADKAGLAPATTPRQLHVFDDPARDDRGWVLSVAHVLVTPARSVQPVVAARPDDVWLRPVTEARGLPFDHDRIVELAVAELRAAYRERPDPDGLLEEPFTLRRLRLLHEAVLGEGLHPDNFRRLVLDQLHDTGTTTAGTVGRPAALYRRRTAAAGA